MSKFVLIVNFEGGVVDTPMEEWKPEEVQAHLDYYRALNAELRATGELIETAVLAGPELAKVVTSNGEGAGGYRRPVPGVQGMGGGLSDR